YWGRWLKDRKGRVKTWKDDETRLRLHVPSWLATMRLDSIRPRHVKRMVLDLVRANQYAPRTVRHTFFTLHAVYESAFIDDLVDVNPCKLPPGVLPQKVVKDPEWRATAIYTRDEVERLISDPR